MTIENSGTGAVAPRRGSNPRDELASKVLQANAVQLTAVRCTLDGTPPPKHQDDPPFFLTIKESAKRCGWSRKTMYNLIERGRVRPVEIKPGMRRIRTSDLEKLASTAEVTR